MYIVLKIPGMNKHLIIITRDSFVILTFILNLKSRINSEQKRVCTQVNFL